MRQRLATSLVTSVLACALVVGVAPAPADAAPLPRAAFHGSTGNLALKEPIVGMAATPSGRGYWLVASDGGIFSFGDARFHGSTGALRLRSPIVGMAPTPSGRGYWLVASDGGIFSFGDAGFHGSAGGGGVPAPIVGIAAHWSGHGYWLAGADGRVYAFGQAPHLGNAQPSPGRPVVAIAASPFATGYWLAARDGGIFRFGSARFYGSTGNLRLNQPIVDMAASPFGGGYWLVGADGGIFSFGDVAFHGSTGNLRLNRPVVGMTAAGDGRGYWFVASDGGIFTYRGPPAGPRGPYGMVPRRLANPQNPLRVMVTGDSMPFSFQDGLDVALRSTGRAEAVKVSRWGYGFTSAWPALPPCHTCQAIPHYAAPMLSGDARRYGFDAAVIMVSGWDVFARQVGTRVYRPFEPDWRAWYRGIQDDAMRRLGSRGGLVFWIGYPTCDGAPSVAARLEFNAIAAATAQRHGHVVFLDPSPHLCPGGPVRNDLRLPDGRAVGAPFDHTGHFTPRGGEWIGHWITDRLRGTFGL